MAWCFPTAPLITCLRLSQRSKDRNPSTCSTATTTAIERVPPNLASMLNPQPRLNQPHVVSYTLSLLPSNLIISQQPPLFNHFHLTSKPHALRPFSLIFKRPPDIEIVVKHRLNAILSLRQAEIAAGPPRTAGVDQSLVQSACFPHRENCSIEKAPVWNAGGCEVIYVGGGCLS